MLNSDSKGFLVGDPIDLKRTMDIWAGIRNDIREIRSRLFDTGKAASASQRQQPPASIPVPRSSTRGKQSLVNNPRNGMPQDENTSLLVSVLSKPAATPIGKKKSSSPAHTNAVPLRDDKGRFIKNSNDKTVDDDDEEEEESKGNRIIGHAAERIASAISDTSSGLEDTDPTVKAINEVAQPLARGYTMLSFGRAKEKKHTDRWFRRIFGELKLFRKEETAFSKAANKRLKAIEEKPADGGRGSGLLSMFLLPIGALISALAFMGKKIPAVSALLTGAKSFTDLFSGFTDDDLTTGDRNKKIAQGAGGVAGTAGGMFLGAKYGAIAGGPVGAIVGALAGIFLGDMGGRSLGEKISDIIGEKFDIREELTGALDRSLSSMEDQFDGLMNKYGSMLESISSKITSTWDSLTNSIKDKFGIDVKEKISAAGEAIKKSPVGRAASSVMSKINYATDKASEFADKAGAKITGSASKNEDALIRQMNRSGITDPTEQAMFMAQMSHESAGFTQMEESFNYRSADRIMQVSKTARNKGKEAVEAAMSQGPEAVAELMYGGRMGNVNPGDGHRFRGRGHIQLTGRNNYEAAGKDLGIDLVNNPDLASDPETAAQIATWYWQKNNLGGKARAGDVMGVRRAINGGYNGLEDVQARHASYVASLPATASLNAKTVSANVPSMPTLPQPPKIQDAPAIAEPLTTGSSRSKQQIVINQAGEVGQDVKDRRIAHIVTGGMSD